MIDRVTREHVLRRRAEQVRNALRDMWGDELPPTPDPTTTVLVDAVALDDERGAQERLVVQGDGLTHAALAALLDAAGRGAVRAVPLTLRAAVADLVAAGPRRDAVLGVDRLPAHDPALPGPASGAWEYDAAAGTVAWDAVNGAICGLAGRPGHATLEEWLRRGVHEDDRTALAEALRASATTGSPYDVRFRVLPPGRARVVSHGRPLTTAAGVKVLGFSASWSGA